MKKILLILLIFFLFQIVFALEECQRVMQPNDVPCNIISTWHPTGNCNASIILVYNSTTINIRNITWGEYAPYCNATWNISTIGAYHYNSSIEDGIINIQGDDDAMIFTTFVFLLGINLVIFLLPFWVKFLPSEGGNYMMKRFIWSASILLLWFNTLILRQVASDWGLGIDDFLFVYWWIFTLAAFIVVFYICYVGVVGGMKLLNETQLRRRMGEEV